MYNFYKKDGIAMELLIQKAIAWTIPSQFHGKKFKRWFMRFYLTCAFLSILLIQVGFCAVAQSITMSKKNAAITEVFKDIKSQTGYDFVYVVGTLKNAKLVTIELSNVPLKDALDRCFANQPFSYNIQNKTVVVVKRPLSSSVLPAVPDIKVTGRVTDTTGIPLPGATVKNNTSNKLATTDQNGDFSILAQPGEKITVSFIGYQSFTFTATVIAPYQSIQLRVASDRLKEVIVTSGYQNLSKERATGAIEHVGQDLLSKRAVSDISSSLQGLVAGVQAKENADGTMSFLVRGGSSMYATTAPLVVVDGFPIQNAAGTNADFSSINPNDVESIDILKDAAAAAIWGARSANGVIVITTKKSKGKQGLTIDGSAFVKVSAKPDLNQLLTTANSADMIRYERLAFQNNWTFASSIYSGGAAFPNDINYSLTLGQRLLYANKYGQISTGAMNAGLDSLSQINNNSQIQDNLLRRSLINQYNVTISSNTDRSKTYSSLLFENNQSTHQKIGYNRYDINFSNEYKLTKYLTFNFGTFLQYNSQQNSGATLSEIQSLSPYETLLNPDGSYSKNVSGYNDYALSQIPLSKFPYSDLNYNLLREMNGRDLQTKSYLARIQTGLTLKIIPGLNFTSSLQYERGKIDVNNYYSDDTYAVRSYVDTYVQYNNTTKTVGTSYVPKGGINTSNTTNSTSYMFRNQLNYNKSFGKNSISAIGAFEISENRADLRTNPAQFGYNPTTLQSVVPPYGYGSSANLLYSFTSPTAGSTLNASTFPGANGATTLSYNLNRYVSVLSKIDYTYDDKYTLSVSARSDASNYITKITSLRWKPFWTVSGKWNVKHESFAQGIGWMDDLSIRLSYGRQGNTVTSTSTNTLLTVGTTPTVSTGTIAASIADLGNPTLRWEKTATTDLGIDFGLFKNKLYGSLDLYNKVGTDITGQVQLPSATGTYSQLFNNAGITNRGIELTIGTQGKILRSDLSYGVSLIYFYNKNTINNLYYPSRLAGEITNPPTTYIEGRPLNAVYSYVYTGMQNGVPTISGPQGTPVDMAQTFLYAANIGTTFLVYQGTTTPPHSLNFRPSLGYKNFNLTAFFVGTFGGVYRNPTFNFNNAYVGSNKTFVNRWVADVFANNPNIPSFPTNGQNNFYLWQTSLPYLNTLVESSSYVQCKDLVLEYNLPKTMLKKTNIRNIRAFLQASNLGMVYVANKNGYNPDWLPGTERPLATYTLGVNVGF